MSSIVEIIVKSGIIQEDNLDELRRWGLPIPPRQDDPGKDYQPDIPMSSAGLCQAIDKAMLDQGYVLTRETDLDLVPRFLRTMRMGKLHMVNDAQEAGDTEIQIGQHSSGEYIIPWEGDDIIDIMTNGETYLVDGQERIFFGNAREIFFGPHKAFMLCTPSTKERHGSS